MLDYAHSAGIAGLPLRWRHRARMLTEKREKKKIGHFFLFFSFFPLSFVDPAARRRAPLAAQSTIAPLVSSGVINVE